MKMQLPTALEPANDLLLVSSADGCWQQSATQFLAALHIVHSIS